MNAQVLDARRNFDFYAERDKVHEAMEWAYNLWGCSELTSLTIIEWNDRFKRRAADACYKRNSIHRIRLSTWLWPLKTIEERRETAIHEAAHVAAPYLALKRRGAFQNPLNDMPGSVQFIRTPKIGHGYEWKRLMRQAGLQPKRCHNIDTYGLGISKRRGPRKKIHVLVKGCACPDGLVVGPTVAQRLKRGVQYSCRKCGCFIKPVFPMQGMVRT